MSLRVIYKSYKSRFCFALYLRAYCTGKMSYMPKICFHSLPPPKEKENYNSAACWRLFLSQSPCKIVLEALKLKHEHWLPGRALKTKTFTGCKCSVKIKVTFYFPKIKPCWKPHILLSSFASELKSFHGRNQQWNIINLGDWLCCNGQDMITSEAMGLSAEPQLVGHRNLIHPSSRADGAWAEELLGKPSLQPAGNEVLSQLVALGQIKQETNPFENAHKLDIPRRSLRKHQNTIPKFPRLQLIFPSSTEQLRELPKLPGCCAEGAEDTLARLPRATAPQQGVQELQQSDLSQALSASSHGNHCGAQAPSTSQLSASQPLEGAAQGHQLEFGAPRPWTESSKAELPGLSCSRNQARTPQMG